MITKKAQRVDEGVEGDDMIDNRLRDVRSPDASIALNI